MNTILRFTGLILILISPLFSALLTDDLEVVIPTGLQASQDYCAFSGLTGEASSAEAILVVGTPTGSMLVRQVSHQGNVPSQAAAKNDATNKTVIILNTLSARKGEREKLKVKVILE